MHASVQKTIPVVFCLIAVAPAPAAAQESEARYVSASSLNVRAAPETASQALGRFDINTKVRVLRTLPAPECKPGGPFPCGPRGWCLAETWTANPDLRGYVACEFLSAKPISINELVAELDDLESKRSFKDEPPALEEISRTFELAGRIFALDRSTASLKRYEELLDALMPGWNESPPPRVPAPGTLEAERAKRIGAYREMQGGVTRDVGTELAARPRDPNASLYASGPRREIKIPGRAARPKGASILARDDQIAAWAGGYTMDRARGSGRGEGVGYFLGIHEEPNIQQLFHVARALGTTPSVKAFKAGQPGQEQEHTVLEGKIKGYAVTPNAVRDATVLRVADVGGGCAEPPSGLDFRLPRPENEVLAVFVTPNRFDPAQARVTRREQRYRASPDTLAHDVIWEADLNGDGIADLRGGFTDNQETDASEPTPKGYSNKPPVAGSWGTFASFYPPYLARLRRAAGWYAENVSWVEANIGGVWKVVSIYALTTCT